MGERKFGYFLLFATFFAFASLGIWICDIDMEEKFLVVGCNILLAFSTWLGWKRTRRDRAFQGVFALIAAYVWFAYPVKLIILSSDVQSSWIAAIPFLSDVTPAGLASSYLLIAPSLAVFLLALSWVRSSPGSGIEAPKPGFRFVCLIAALLLTKVVLQSQFSIAVPGVEPVDLGVPFLNGILAFIVGFFLVMLANLYLFHALYAKSIPGLLLALFLVFLLIATDLWVGYKQALVFQVVLIMLYLGNSAHRMTATRKRLMYVVLAVGLLVGGGLYPYVNEYRYALLSGSDVFSAIEIAVRRVGSGVQESGLMGFVNRINGIENFYAASRLGGYYNYDAAGLLNQSLGNTFNYEIYSSDEAVTQFGLTQFGAFYVVGGYAGLLVGSLLAGVLIRVSGVFFLNRIIRRSTWADALAPLLALWFVKVLFAGGVLLLYTKEFIFIAAAVYFLRAFFVRYTLGSRVRRGFA